LLLLILSSNNYYYLYNFAVKFPHHYLAFCVIVQIQLLVSKSHIWCSWFVLMNSVHIPCYKTKHFHTKVYMMVQYFLLHVSAVDCHLQVVICRLKPDKIFIIYYTLYHSNIAVFLRCKITRDDVCVFKILKTNQIFICFTMPRYYLLHILLVFIYGIYAATNKLCHSDSHTLFVWCRMPYSGVFVVNIPIVGYCCVFLKGIRRYCSLKMAVYRRNM